MDEITVGIVSYYSAPHLVHLIPNLRRTTVNSRLKFIICDNTNGKDQELYWAFKQACEILPYAPVNPRKGRRERASGSFVHALGLNYLLTKVETEYCLFMDPDCMVLTEGWDIICKNHLKSSTIAVGTPYHRRKIIKYSDFPSPIFVFFNPIQFRRIGVDWIPYTDSNVVYLWDQFLRILAITGSKFGEVILGDDFYTGKGASWMRKLFGGSSKDTGWKIPHLARRHGFSSYLIQAAASPQELVPQIAGNTQILELMTKFELFTYRGMPFLTHFHGTRHRRKKDKEEVLSYWRKLASDVGNTCEDLFLNSSTG
jgi:hypothetical protein